MSVYNYSPRNHDDRCEPCESTGEAEYPSTYLDIGPEQLRGLEVGDTVEIVLKGKIKSLRFDTDDSWGTGASVGVSLRSCSIKDSEEQTIIDSMIDED